jgi:chromosome segregation ATPase
MTERLDRIEAILLQVAQQQAANTQAIEGNSRDIDALVEAISNTDVNVRGNTAAVTVHTQQLETTGELITANAQQLETIGGLITASAQRLEDTRALVAANAQQIAITDALTQRNAEAIAANETRFNIVIEELRADRAEWRKQFRAMTQATQALLVQIGSLNGRIENLEQAS